MKKCGYQRLVSSYHDGELEEKESRAVERHIDQCKVCADLLADLRSISGVFARMERPNISTAAKGRIRSGLKGVKERFILRFATANVAAAAAILFVCSALLAVDYGTEDVTEPAAWETAAITLGEDASSNGGEFRMARWLIEELGGEEFNERN